jgi:hypothetical protein
MDICLSNILIAVYFRVPWILDRKVSIDGCVEGQSKVELKISLARGIIHKTTINASVHQIANRVIHGQI